MYHPLKSVLALLFTFFLQISICQVEKDKIIFVSADQIKGTFQFEVTDEKYQTINMTGELLERIEKNRNQEEIVFLDLNENCRVKIYPVSQIAELKKTTLPLYIFRSPVRKEN